MRWTSVCNLHFYRTWLIVLSLFRQNTEHRTQNTEHSTELDSLWSPCPGERRSERADDEAAERSLLLRHLHQGWALEKPPRSFSIFKISSNTINRCAHFCSILSFLGCNAELQTEKALLMMIELAQRWSGSPISTLVVVYRNLTSAEVIVYLLQPGISLLGSFWVNHTSPNIGVVGITLYEPETFLVAAFRCVCSFW